MTSSSSRTILIIGLAREGLAAARWLAQNNMRVTASDLRPPDDAVQEELERLGVDLRIGRQTPALLEKTNALIVSPGVPQDIPLLQAARQRHLPITTEPRLFAQQCPAPLIGITGSSGKTTTTTLVARILETTGHKTWIGGNIGAPLLPHLDEIHPSDQVVMELSSFQLYYWGPTASCSDNFAPWCNPAPVSPHIAAILNITPNHLDRHPSMAHYTAAKANILAAQTPDDIAVLNREDSATALWAKQHRVTIPAGSGQQAVTFPLRSRLLTFGFDKMQSGSGTWLENGQIWLRWQGQITPVLDTAMIRLRGRHNLANVLAAVAIVGAAGIAPEAVQETVQTFNGVPHRLEEVAHIGDVLWINDSIATAPERALAALRSFEQPIILLAGGRDKHLPWQEWAKEVHRRVRTVIAFGEATRIIQKALADAPSQSQLQNILIANDLAEAVQQAYSLSCPGDVVLLSPGGTSFDAYTDFAARGEHFRHLVRRLQSHLQPTS